MLVSALAAGLVLFADAAPAAQSAPAPQMKRVCVKVKTDEMVNRMTHLSCTLEPVTPTPTVAQMTAPAPAKTGDKVDASTNR
jgi:hypothetical protein